MPDAIESLFAAVSNIVRSAGAWPDGLQRAVSFARDNPTLLARRTFWDTVASHDFNDAFATAAGWARHSLSGIDLSGGWEFVTLTVGDAPEKFQLCHSGPQALAAEKPFRECMFGETLIGVEDLDRCSESGWWWRPDYTVTELFDGVLSYSRSAAPPFHGSDGYFLWHLFASLALVAPLSEPSFRELVLQGCERVYLLSGSGSLFVYLATVTKEGMQYERP